MNLLDRMVLAFSPVRAEQRARARYMATMIEHHHNRSAGSMGLRRFDGAGRGPRFDGWSASGGGPNAEIGAALPLLRARCRDLAQNDRWASKAIKVLSSWTIGTGIRPQARPADDDELELAKRTQGLWEDWGESTDCDVRGRHNFYGLQRAVDREVKVAGECLVRRRFRRPSDGLAVPMQLEVLEPDHLDGSKSGQLPNGGVIVQGVQFGPLGQREGYWLHRDHPGEDPSLGSGIGIRGSRFVRAADVLHVFREDRAGQVRGVPWGAAAIVVLRDWADFADAQLLRQKIAACYVAFIQDADPAQSIQDLTGKAPTPASDPIRPGDQLDAGTMEFLPFGKSVTFANPPGVEGFRDFSEVTLQGVAAAYGTTYAALTTDLRGTSFTSGRMGWLEMFAEVGQFQHLELLPTLCTPVWRWFTEAATDSGKLPRALPARWTTPRRPYLDPRREVLAQRDAIRAGLTSLPEEIRAQGRAPAEVIEEARHHQGELEAAGLLLDTDLRASSTPAAGGSSGPQGRELAESADRVAALLGEARGLEDVESDLAAAILELAYSATGRRNGSART